MLRWLIVLPLFLFTFASCATGSKMWEPYQGCNAAQCQSWYEECRAQCINNKGSVTECDNKCTAKKEPCLSACN